MATVRSRAKARARDLVSALHQNADRLDRRAFVGIHSSNAREGDVEAAVERGLFRVGEERSELSPPIDWSDQPYAASDEGAFLRNCFFFADPLLLAEASEDSHAEVVASLAAIYLDWIDQNPRARQPRPHKYAWHDHAAAARLVHLAYMLREGHRLGALGQKDELALAKSIIEHVDFLLAEENYQPAHNHGLFSDAAIKLAADTLPFAPESAEWAAVATDRYRKVVDRTIERSEGVHLEHSPYYQLVMLAALERFAPARLLPPPEQDELLERMDEAAAWLTSPDGTLPPVGDTGSGAKPSAAVQDAARSVDGLRQFTRSGYSVVRRGGSYLLVTAGFHGPAHKHADDLGYCLYERGRMIVGDSGTPGYDFASAERRFCVSPSAHSNIAIDAHNWIADSRGGYGSGLLAAGEGGGWYAILAENPRIAADARVARRLFLYKPGVALAVLDEVSASAGETVERHLQFAPELSIDGAGAGSLAIEDGGGRWTAAVKLFAEDAGSDSISVIRGGTDPPLGLFFPAIGESIPRTTVRLSRPGGGAFGYALALSRDAVAAAPVATGSLTRARAGIAVSGLDGTTLTVEEDDGVLSVAAVRAT